jgi:hypothetical protein
VSEDRSRDADARSPLRAIAQARWSLSALLAIMPAITAMLVMLAIGLLDTFRSGPGELMRDGLTLLCFVVFAPAYLSVVIPRLLSSSSSSSSSDLKFVVGLGAYFLNAVVYAILAPRLAGLC